MEAAASIVESLFSLLVKSPVAQQKNQQGQRKFLPEVFIHLSIRDFLPNQASLNHTVFT